VDKIIVHNKYSLDQAKNIVTSLKICVIKHGNYIPFIQKSKNNSKSKDGSKLKILFFGQIKKVKGLDLILTALGLLKQRGITKFELTIAGKLWKDNFTTYKSIINKYNLLDHIILHIGYVPNEKVDYYFEDCDIVILPYLKVYQSGVLLKAMSYKKAVLVSDLCPFTEIIKDGQNGYVFKAGDIHSLCEKLIYIMNNINELNKIGNEAYEYVKTNHDWMTIAEEVFNLYKKMLLINS
jgi:glycosyltransferase involved in cell wall biosynthesis